ncbi:hypothetical protein Tco_0961817 [Tanacetum coccineum]
MLEFNQTSQFAKAVSLILGIFDQYLASKMKEAVDVAVRLQSNKLKEEAEAENQEFFNQVDSTMKAIIKEQESRSSSSSKDTKYLPKSSGKSTQAEEPEFEAADIEMQQDQGSEFGHTDDWFQKLNKPPTPNRAWNKSKSVDFRPPYKWIGNIAKAIQPPRMFDELLSTPIDFSAYGPASFNPVLKGSCKSFAELEFHFEECYKAVNDRLDWNNPEGHEYTFDLSKPLLLIEDRGCQVVPADYFINNDLEYLKEGSSSRRYTTSTTRTKAAKYDNIEGIEDMVPTLWNLVKDKLSNLDVDYRYNLGVALRMFTRRIVILYRVEDLQLGVESYQKKLNITRPETT